MKNKLDYFLSFKVFNEDKDLQTLKELKGTAVRSIVIFLSFVFSLWCFALILLNPKDDNIFVVLGFAISLKSIEVLINWHLGLKNMAKNSLILIIIATSLFVLLRNI